MNRLQIARAGSAITLLFGMVVAAPAAADFYVDDDGGSDANACTATSAPCATITAALSKASADTVWVDGGVYGESVDVGDGNSLRELDFNAADGDDQATISAVAGFPALRVLGGDPAGTISGFTVHGNGYFAVELADGAIFSDNELDAIEDGAPGISVSGGTATISDNLLDATIGGVSVGIEVVGGAPNISGNRLRDLTDAIRLPAGGGAWASITGNTITGLTRELGFAAGISLGETTSATIAGNEIRDPDPTAQTIGVNAQNDGFTVLGVNAQLSGNRISGQDIGLRLADTALSSLSSDMITANGVGLIAASSGIGSGDISATNATITGNGTDVSISNSELGLDSSIVGDAIAAAGTASCTISHSAGPAIGTAADGCEDFTTSADPRFVDPGDGDYHLAPNSPLIDAGDPAPVTAEDIDGDDRVIDGDGDGSVIRDIGADEFVPDPVPPAVDTTAPTTTITAGLAAGSISAETTPSFAFVADDPAAAFQCRLDGAAFAPCTSPERLGPLADGRHDFLVRATDPAGNVESPPAGRRFGIDATAPETTITSWPRRRRGKRDRTPTFTFTANEPGATFSCSIDRAAFAPCASPFTTPRLARRRHRLSVLATDTVGNRETTAAQRRFKIKRRHRRR